MKLLDICIIGAVIGVIIVAYIIKNKRRKSGKSCCDCGNCMHKDTCKGH